MPDPQQQQNGQQAPPPIDFSSIGGKPVQQGPIDFSAIGGKPVSPAPQSAPQNQPPAAPQKWEKAIVPAMGGGFIAVDVPQGEAAKYEAAHARGMEKGGKIGLSMLGSAALPEAIPEELGGSGVLGYLSRIFLRSGASGAGAALGNSAGQALTGNNPLSTDNLAESGRVGLTTAALSLPLEAIGQIPFTKLGRSAINQSLGAQTRDVTYGNPALALTKEDIGDVATGDYEAYKSALRAGNTPAEAAQAAGGRFAAVSQRINELAPRLASVLSKSQATIPVSDVIDKPLNQAAFDIIANPAMTDLEKDTAVNQLGALQKTLKQGLGPNATPSQLQAIKQAIGNRVNWGGNVAVTDEVKPAYRAVYASLKNGINQAVPEAGPINERLTNLLAAQSDLDNLARAEEVGRGVGLSRGKIGSSLFGAVEAGAGKLLPSATNLNNPLTRASIGAAAGLPEPLLGGDRQ